MTEETQNNKVIDLEAIFKTLLAKKKVFFIMWAVVFALSCLWIFPQPRYYSCEVSLAPEASGENAAGGLSSIASTFGINLDGGGADAIYPELYPDLFESPKFLVSLFGIQVTTIDDSLHCNYYTYLAKHQQKNWLLEPFNMMIKSIKEALSTEPAKKAGDGNNVDPFRMSKFDFNLTELIKGKIKCSVDKKTSVISISVNDQDALVCAMLADSISERLQSFITEYRTHKTRIDVQHYQELTDSANLEYRSAVNKYAQFCDANQEIILQSQQSQRDELENEMQMSYNTYQAMKTQLEAMKAKLQERTPAFTTLKSATVPLKPAGPKRIMFILLMLILATSATCVYVLRKNVLNYFKS